MSLYIYTFTEYREATEKPPKFTTTKVYYTTTVVVTEEFYGDYKNDRLPPSHGSYNTGQELLRNEYKVIFTQTAWL